jgi:hypothetical protein
VSRTRHGSSFKDKRDELLSIGFVYETQAKGWQISVYTYVCLNVYTNIDIPETKDKIANF